MTALVERFARAMTHEIESGGAPAPSRRVLDARCVVGIDGTPFLLEFAAGRLIACRPHQGLLVTYDFAVHGTAAAWSSLWEDPPRPGRQDLLGLYKVGEIRLEGRLEPFMAHLQYFKDLLASPRKHRP